MKGGLECRGGAGEKRERTGGEREERNEGDRRRTLEGMGKKEVASSRWEVRGKAGIGREEGHGRGKRPAGEP